MKCGAIKKAWTADSPTAPIVVIGYGNTYRHDDGAGPVLAERLVRYWAEQGIWAKLVTDTQLLPEMAADIAENEVEAVIFVDSCVQGLGSIIQICQVDLNEASPSSGHFLEPATLLVYAALLYGHYPAAWLVSVVGNDLSHGEGFSEEVEALISDVAPLATRLHREMKETVPCMN